MKRLNLIVIVVIAVLCSTDFNDSVLYAQDNFGITNRTRVDNVVKREKKSPAPAVRVVSKIVYKPRDVVKLVYPTGLSIVTSPNAEISLEAISPKNKFKKSDKANAEGMVAFENLRAGKYKLVVSLKGYQPQETDITVQLNKISTTSVDLKRITYDFSIQTNVEKGEVRFAPAKIIEQNSDGTVEVQETGGYCVVPIDNQKAVIKELPEGTYNIDVSSPEFPEYQRELRVIEIPEDIPETKADEPNKDTSFKISLKYNLSTETFNQISTPDAWTLPEKWKIDVKGLKADDIGIALPKNVLYRYYKDFEMRSTVRLLDNVAVGFVVRAEDNQNYYLIQLTGAASKEPYRVSGFIVKNGKPERVMENPIPHLAKVIDDKKDFEVIIKGQGDKFEVVIEDSKTGDKYPLGNVVFPNNNFPIGAVGLGVIEKSNFEVGLFSVCNSYCK